MDTRIGTWVAESHSSVRNGKVLQGFIYHLVKSLASVGYLEKYKYHQLPKIE